ncbi:MAG: DMT family transporter [Betaproteobacteria bacterium]|nr:DMT family transporter [Betaproteobacteria bacterium]MDE2622902.1 DMT family transporter [Betaproteobacteria bacterium]
MFERFANPYLILTLTALFWSSNMVVGRAFSAEVPPFAFAFGRWTIAALFIFPLALPHLKSQWPQLRQGWRTLLILGLLGIGGYNTLAYMGLQYTTATNAALLNSFIPIATISLSWAFFGKRLTRLESFGVLISLTGVLTIVGQGSLARLAGLHLNLGDLWLLLAVLDWAFYTIALGWRPAGVHPMLMLAAMILIGLVALAPATVWEMAQGRHAVITPASMTAIAYVGIFPGFISYVFYNRGVAAIGASKASLFIHLMPVFGTLLAAVFLSEAPHAYHFVGIALIFTGIGLTMARRSR